MPVGHSSGKSANRIFVILDKASFAVFPGVSSVTHDKLVDTVDENHRLTVATLKDMTRRGSGAHFRQIIVLPDSVV